MKHNVSQFEWYNSIDTIQQGLVDFIGFAGFNPDQQSSISLPTPFSVSLKQTPALLSYLSCVEEEESIPSELEWFCYPSIDFKLSFT